MAGMDGKPSRIRDVDRNSKILRDIPSKLYPMFDAFTSEANRDLDGLRHHLGYDHHRVGRDLTRTTKDGVVTGLTSCCKENEDPFHGFYHRDGGLIVNFKRNLPVFDGFWHTEDLMSWIDAIEDFFEEIGPPEHLKCKIVWYKMKGAAYYWWKMLQYDRSLEGKNFISSWPTMKQLLLKRFMPATCSMELPSNGEEMKATSTIAKLTEQIGKQRKSNLDGVSVKELSKETIMMTLTKYSTEIRIESHSIKRSQIQIDKFEAGQSSTGELQLKSTRNWSTPTIESSTTKLGKSAEKCDEEKSLQQKVEVMSDTKENCSNDCNDEKESKDGCSRGNDQAIVKLKWEHEVTHIYDTSKRALELNNVAGIAGELPMISLNDLSTSKTKNSTIAHSQIVEQGEYGELKGVKVIIPKPAPLVKAHTIIAFVVGKSAIVLEAQPYISKTALRAGISLSVVSKMLTVLLLGDYLVVNLLIDGIALFLFDPGGIIYISHNWNFMNCFLSCSNSLSLDSLVNISQIEVMLLMLNRFSNEKQHLVRKLNTTMSSFSNDSLVLTYLFLGKCVASLYSVTKHVSFLIDPGGFLCSIRARRTILTNEISIDFVSFKSGYDVFSCHWSFDRVVENRVGNQDFLSLCGPLDIVVRVIGINSEFCAPCWIKLGDKSRVASLHLPRMVIDKRCPRAVTFSVKNENAPAEGIDNRTSFMINDVVIQAFIITPKAYEMLDLKPIICICAFGCGGISLANSVVVNLRAIIVSVFTICTAGTFVGGFPLPFIPHSLMVGLYLVNCSSGKNYPSYVTFVVLGNFIITWFVRHSLSIWMARKLLDWFRKPMVRSVVLSKVVHGLTLKLPIHISLYLIRGLSLQIYSSTCLSDRNLYITRGRVIPWEGWNDEYRSNRDMKFIVTMLIVFTISLWLSILWDNGHFKKTLRLFFKMVNGLDPPMDAMMSLRGFKEEFYNRSWERSEYHIDSFRSSRLAVFQGHLCLQIFYKTRATRGRVYYFGEGWR